MNLYETEFPVDRRPAESTPESAAVPAVERPTPVAAAAEPSAGRSWVPIRSLGPRHHERILAHLLALDERARYLRFGHQATDAQVARYVDTLDFEHDEVFGIFNRRLALIAMAHLAYRPADASRGRAASAEFGVSVLPQARRRGFGRRLFEHATLHARNRGVVSIFIHALSENTAMLKIVRDAGATVQRDGPEAEAWLTLPPDSLASHLDEFLGERAAELDYRLKQHANQVENLFKRSDKS
jgi:ribosomal protein S18 acetylase RimI-like enzyme